jgi:serine/threonine protein kinase
VNPSERRARVEHLFEAALDRPEGERERFVRESCAGDEELRAQVMALLTAHARVGGALDGPPVPERARERERETEAERFGPYRVLHPLGSGGMGDVYLAVREDAFMRRVALKVLRGGAWSPTAVERFETERQIMASLSHPNVAQLLDGGVNADGTPYLVMEYVEGLPITVFSDRQGLTVAERLELFLKVCAAVHHAHQNLVIHRDLKPSNILVATNGEPKLLDFGVAKLQRPAAVGRTGPVTRPDLRPLTPEYASPEQLRGEPLTTASDVYALGVLLYELLTGRHPFDLDGASPSEVARLVCETDPPRPSASDSASKSIRYDLDELRGDLDMIVMMALKKEPGRRYASAEQLASDVRRHLDGEPVLAVGDSPSYRLRKLVRRRRVEALSAALVLLSLIAGLTIAVAQWRVVGEERDRATRALERAEASADFLVGLFQSQQPLEAIADTLSARAILERGLERIGALEPYPELRARLLTVLGQAYNSLGAYDRAEAVLRAAVQDWALPNQSTVPRDIGREAARTLAELGDVLRIVGRYDEALDVARQAHDLRVATLGARDADVATSLIQMSSILVYLGDLQRADSLTRLALDVRRRALGEEDPRVTNAIEALAALSRRRGDVDEAEALLREAVTRRRTVQGADAPAHATALLRLASLLDEDRGARAEAEALYRRALAILPDSDPEATTAMSQLGDVLVAEGQFQEAIELHSRAVEARRALMGADHSSVADVVQAKGLALLAAGNDRGAEEAFNEARSIWEARLGPEHPAVVYALSGLAEVYAARNEWIRAEALARQALTVRRDAFPEGSVLVGLSEATLGDVLSGKGDLEEAEALLEEALASVAAKLPPEHRDVRSIHAKLARLYDKWDRPEEAARHRNLAGEPPPR